MGDYEEAPARPEESHEGEDKEAEERARKLAEYEAKLKYITEQVVHDGSNIVFGSAAGAGSSTYHIYRRSRRNEEDRWRRIEQYEKEKKEQDEFERKRKALEDEDRARLEKNRAKRAKKKQKSKKKKEGTGGSSNDEAKEAGRSPQRVEEAHPAGGDTDADSDGAPEVADLD